MTRNDVPPSEEKPRVEIVGCGGTIMSGLFKEEGNPQMIIRPHNESMNELIAHMGSARRKLHDKMDRVIMDPLIDSSQAVARDHICRVVSAMRHKIKHNPADIFIVLYGSDTMPELMNALGNGISKNELGKKAVIVTCSMEHLEVEDSDGFRNFERASHLAATDEVRGKIGLCVGERFMPPRGIEKAGLSRDFSFISRFRRMAKWTTREGWNFDREPEPYDEPRGETHKVFDLIQGVETIELTSTSDYKILPRFIQWNRGTIIKAPGNGNLRTDDRSRKYLKEAVKDANGPIIVVGQAIQNGDSNMHKENHLEDQMYDGDASLLEDLKLMSGGAMTASEARILLSQWLAEAKKNQLRIRERIEFVRTQLSLYPFREVASGKWRPVKRKDGDK